MVAWSYRSFFFLTFLQYSRISSLSVMQLFLSVEETHRPCSPICWARYTSPGSHKVATLGRGKIRSLKVCTLASKRKTHLAQSTTLSKCFASQEIVHLNYRINQSLFFFANRYYKKVNKTFYYYNHRELSVKNNAMTMRTFINYLFVIILFTTIYRYFSIKNIF